MNEPATSESEAISVTSSKSEDKVRWATCSNEKCNVIVSGRSKVE